MSSRVRIGSCSGPADAALVRSMLEAHGIAAVVGGERHAGLLGGLGGGLVSLDIFVASEDVEDASALLEDLRSGVRDGDDADAETDGDAAADDADDDAHAAAGPLEVEPADDPDFHVRLDRRKRTGVAVLLAVCISFGTAHMYARAWLAGIVLAGLEIVGFTQLGRQPGLGGGLVLGAIALDLIGAVWRIRSTPQRPPLPSARVHK